MGYTNYWSPKELTREEIPEAFWSDCAAVINAVLRKGIRLGDGVGKKEYKSGEELIGASQSARTPCIVFNGLEELGEDYETFALYFDGDWSFCKTAHEPYDVAVKCILMLAKKYELLMPRDENEGEPGGFSWDGDEGDPEYQDASEIITAFEIFNK